MRLILSPSLLFSSLLRSLSGQTTPLTGTLDPATAAAGRTLGSRSGVGGGMVVRIRRRRGAGNTGKHAAATVKSRSWRSQNGLVDGLLPFSFFNLFLQAGTVTTRENVD